MFTQDLLHQLLLIGLGFVAGAVTIGLVAGSRSIGGGNWRRWW